MAVTARTDLNNIGGQIDAANSLNVAAGRDLNIASTTTAPTSTLSSVGPTVSSFTGLDRVAGLYITNPGGTLLASAGRDANIVAGVIQSQGSAQLQAGNNINLNTVTKSDSVDATRDERNYTRFSQSQDVGSQLSATGNLSLVAGKDINATAASVTSQQGALVASAGNNVNINAGKSQSSLATATFVEDSDAFSSGSTEVRQSASAGKAISSSLSGNTVTVVAGNDISVKGSSVISDTATTLAAGNNLSIEAVTNTSSSNSFQARKQDGLLDDGGGISIGTQERSTQQKAQGTSAAASTVGSIAGNVTLQAGEAYKQVGSDVMAPAGDVTILAKKVDITEARETSRQETEDKFKQSALTFSVSSPLLSAVETGQQMADAASNTSDGRMQALAGAAAAFKGYNTYKGMTDASGNFNKDAATDVTINISYGTSESESKSSSQSNSAAGSTVAAGKNLTIVATGAGQASNLTAQGANLTAGNNVTLLADNNVNLLASQSNASQESSNSSSSSSVGVSYGLISQQFSFSASASQSQGNSSGSDTRYTNTQVNAGNTASIISGGDTNLIGAVVAANTVKANVGGNLNIQSLQDTSTYTSEQSSSGASVSYGKGSGAGGGVSASNSKIDSSYASVVQQSGIKAGDGGFQVNVAGNTDLKGAVIASTQAAVDNNKNSFSTGGTLTLSDIQNNASYEGKATGLSIDVGQQAGKFGVSGVGVGIGSDKGEVSSTSSSGISGIAGNTAVRSTDAETGIAKIFDADRVQKEITAQVQIMQAFTKEAPKATASFAAGQAADLRKAGNEGEAKKWDEGGIYRIALHTLTGALSGGISGAAGGAASAGAANLMNDFQDGIQKGLEDSGMSKEAARAIAQSLATVTAAGIGAAVGGTQGAVMAATVDANNRQLHPTEAQLIKANAAKYAALRQISLEKAEAELTQQALRNVDTAHAERLGVSDIEAQAFLKELGAGQSFVDASTGQRFELFAADAATSANHAMFGQYAKNNPTVEAALDRAYQSAFKPVGGQTIAGLNGSNAGALTGSDLALNDAARDYRNMRQQPPAVQWSVLGELRQERRENLSTQLKLTQELQELNSKNDTSGAAALRRGQIFTALVQLDQENTTLRQASVEQLKAMGSNGLLNPADQREWIEGVGEALAGGGLGLRGLSAASIAGRLNMLKSAVEEIRATSAAAKAEAQAIATARVENNLGRDGTLDPYAPVPNAQAQADLRAKAAADAANGVSNPHYDLKHGPGTTLEQQHQRAMNGTNPQTGGSGMPADASKFFNATDMQTAIQRAEAAFAANPGAYQNGQISVQFNRPVGEGYTGATKKNQVAGIPAGEYRWADSATVGIDLKTGKAYTAYPNVLQGKPMPDPLKMGIKR